MEDVDVMREIEKVKKIINEKNNIKLNEIINIAENSTGIYSSVYNGFLIGYMRGTKERDKALICDD